MNAQSYFVEVRHRPRRIAFLVDVDQSPDRLFNEIVSFNVSSWGGRHNPIIPVLDGKITDAYWGLLRIVNPDVLYTYCDLPAVLAGRITTDIRPLDVLKHRRLPEGAYQFRVGLDEQVSVIPALRRAVQDVPPFARKPAPAVLLFENVDSLSSFALRNFGANSEVNIWCRNSEIPSLVLAANDTETMKTIAVNRNVILPIDACANAPRRLKAEPAGNEWSIALTIWYGNSPWNFIEFWNSAQFRGTAPSGIKALWMPKGFLDDAAHYEALLELMRRRVFVSEHSSRLRLISYEEDTDYLRELTRRIAKDFKWGLHAADPVARQKGNLPDFKPAAANTPFFTDPSARPRHEQASGESAFIEIIPPNDVQADRNERWIAELVVEDTQQERSFANSSAWWKLPQKERLANLLVPHSPSRVGNDYRICAEVSTQQQGVLLKVPNLSALFSALLIPQVAPDWTRNFSLQNGRSAGHSWHVRSSDKGRYARGVLGLFGTLQRAGYVFEHTYWASVIESLATPIASAHTINKVRNDLQKAGLEALANPDSLDLLVDEVLDVAGRIQRPTPYISFDRLLQLYLDYLEKLSPPQRLIEIHAEHDITDEKQIRDAAYRYLRSFLSELTARKLFFHGAEIHCHNCLAALWYHIDDVQSVIVCRGCRKEMHLPAETRWSYALNELVATAIRDHGVAPVIRTALRLFADSRECFHFLPGIEIRDHKSEPETQVCELDLVWIRDGKFGIAEVKRTPKKFEISKKLTTMLGEALPDQFLLACPSGTIADMQKAQSEARPRMDSRISVDAWGEEQFARLTHIGWNAIRYSML